MLLRLALVFAVIAARSAVPQGTPPRGPDTEVPSAFTDERIEQLVAPIALYSDALLAQVLMASTYPLEVIEASRWRKRNPEYAGAELEAALKEKDWDPSVKALCGLSEVLARMDANLDWMRDLGDAFLADQARLMDMVQRMRRRAADAGTLKSTEEQRVTERDDEIIAVESTSTEVVYVPTYYPSVVYGSWSYPYWYYPPLYVPPPRGAIWFSFTVGVIWGGAIWGGCHWGWGHTEIDIDIERHNDFIGRVDSDRDRHRIDHRASSRLTWRHDAGHRMGVAYRDPKVAERFAGASSDSRFTRAQARGFSDRIATREPIGSPLRGERSGSFSGVRTGGIEQAGSLRGASSRESSARSTGIARGSPALRSSGATRIRGGGRGRR